MGADYYLALVWATLSSWGLTGIVTAAVIGMIAISMIAYVIARLNKS